MNQLYLMFDKYLLKVSIAIRTVTDIQQNNECHKNSQVKTVHKFITVVCVQHDLIFTFSM